MRRLLAAIMLLGCLSVDSRADFTGMDLLNICTRNDNDLINLCKIWIAGFQSGLVAAQTARETIHSSVCLPESFTVQQAILIIEKFMKEHPESLHHSAAAVALRALFDTFPCPPPK